MAFDDVCTVCRNIIKSNDLYVDLKQSINNKFHKLIVDNNQYAHIECFQKAIMNGQDYEQLQIFE